VKAAERTAVMVPCGHCSGRGVVVSGRATEVLWALANLKRSFPKHQWARSSWVGLRVGISGTHAVNELTLLLTLGLVERRGQRGPRGYEWRAR